MTATLKGVFKWGPLAIDDLGHRTYELTTLVETDSSDDGPATVAQTSGLPAVGSTWSIASDVDAYAYCTPFMNVKSVQEGDGERATVWHVDQRFSTRPMIRCNDVQIESPLNEPYAISGGFNPYREEAIYDANGDLLLMSSYERMTGPEVEIELGRPTVRIAFNSATLPLTTFAQMMSTGAVNDSTLWGCAARTIRVAEITWERFLYGVCSYYYRLSYTFEIRFEGWNRFIIDQGTKVRKAAGLPISAANPLISHTNWYTGKPEVTYLDGSANAVYLDQGASVGSIYIWEKELEVGYNLLSLGIPSSL